MNLYRAADDDSILGPTSFALREEDARAYLNNAGFGGSRLWRTTVRPRAEAVLDLRHNATHKLERMTGLTSDGRNAEEWVTSDYVADALLAIGYRWVRLIDSYPEDCETWIWLGASDGEPRLVEVIV